MKLECQPVHGADFDVLSRLTVNERGFEDTEYAVSKFLIQSLFALHGQMVDEQGLRFLLDEQLCPGSLIPAIWLYHFSTLPWHLFPDFLTKDMSEAEFGKQNPLAIGIDCHLCGQQTLVNATTRNWGATPCPSCNGCTTRSDEPLQTLKALSYADYLQSKHWKTTVKLVHQRDNKRCRRCGSPVKLHVHHLHYRNLGQEPLDDLVTLCEPCHQEVHLFPDKHPEWIETKTPKIWGTRDPSLYNPPQGPQDTTDEELDEFFEQAWGDNAIKTPPERSETAT